ncbi:MAG: response regulator [Planctomycetes bacterium]|nr:response regulator [Planctomycetota bacterium]
MDVKWKPLVLLVEDDPLVRACLALMLKHPSYELIVSDLGENALAIARTFSRPVDVLVTDVVMPRLSGPALALALWQANPFMKTVYISGYLPDAPQLQPLLEREELILFKPFEPEMLIRTVLNALSLTQSASPLALA